MIARILRKGPMMHPRFVYAAVALLAGVLVPATVFAQSDSSNQNVQELRKQPFQPFRIYMTDGSQFEIRHPELMPQTRR